MLNTMLNWRVARIWMDRRRRHRLNAAPPAPPSGWETGPPDFIGVGAEKAGTSWWYELLVDHPDIVRPQLAHKELRYFNRFGTQHCTSEDLDRYHKLFARPAGARTGEWSPSYMTDHWVPPLLHRAAPDAKLLVIVRDPVERYVSGLTQLATRGRSAGLTECRAAFERGCYASQLERLVEWFPLEQILVLQYEACVRDPLRWLHRSYEFVDVDADHRPADASRKVHTTTADKAVLGPSERQDLATAYQGEIRRLIDLVPELDLALWSGTTTSADGSRSLP
jgi:hypothetical protein